MKNSSNKMTVKVNRHNNDFDFDVALSFATENKQYVEKIAKELKKSELKVYYSPDDGVELWGKDQYAYFDEIFRKRARFTVLFLSEYYAKKYWTNHERRSAQARALLQNQEYILPARFDHTEIDGLPPTIAYVDLNSTSPKQLAHKIVQKVGHIPRLNYLPKRKERLFKKLNIRDDNEKELLESTVMHLFESLTLMTTQERNLLWFAAVHACPEGVPDNLHLNFDYLLRLSGFKKEQVISAFSRLKFLSFKTRVFKEKLELEDGELSPETRERIEVKYTPLFTYQNNNGEEVFGPDNSTLVLWSIIELFKENFCSKCGHKTFLRADLSILNESSFKEN